MMSYELFDRFNVFLNFFKNGYFDLIIHHS